MRQPAQITRKHSCRKIIAIRKKRREEYQEEEAILETYMSALGML